MIILAEKLTRSVNSVKHKDRICVIDKVNIHNTLNTVFEANSHRWGFIRNSFQGSPCFYQEDFHSVSCSSILEFGLSAVLDDEK